MTLDGDGSLLQQLFGGLLLLVRDETEVLSLILGLVKWLLERSDGPIGLKEFFDLFDFFIKVFLIIAEI